jgi:exopolyphosphatase / guanosine-5'-triphosphate,3'-diphosphate pyrophosphatase
VAELRAAVDCGSNSTRLLIGTTDGSDVVSRRETVTGLGRGLVDGGALDPAGIDRTAVALSAFGDEIRAAGVGDDVRAVATAAARRARDGDRFLAAAHDALGVVPVVLSGTDEARLAFAGATSDLDPSTGPIMVVDIGGGSTELVVGRDVVEAAVSLPMGSVRYTDEYVEHDPPRPEELSSILSLVELHLEDARREHPAFSEATTVVGVAGTVTTVAAVEIGLLTHDPEAIHHFLLSRAAAEDVFRTLATERFDDRVHNPGLPRERADVIVAGCAVLVGTMRFFGVEEMIVSERDLLDGVLIAETWPS